ncbi:MAG: type II secretion system major pseudopilin GspG [Candidatus Sumerlaeia bacterium]
MTQFSLIRRGARRGFTLIEIILVVVIIMTLAAVVGPRITGQGKKQRINITKISIEGLRTSLQHFETQMSRFPTTQEGLQILITKPSGMSDDDWPGKILEKMPKDGFGTEFKYVCPSEHGLDYDIISAGPDKRFGTPDDIANYSDQTNSGTGTGSTSSSSQSQL